MSKKPENEPPTKKREITPIQKRRAKPTAIAPYRGRDLRYDFDRIFDDFRSNFEDLLMPGLTSFPIMPVIETRMPVVDLEDRGKDYLLTAELPGFKKEDVELQVTDDSLEIKASVGWKYDEKSKNYICTERRCDSLYRMIALPETIKSDEVQAELKEGVLEVVLPKKEPKEKKKVALK